MILYFTGTGNSRYVARKISEEINDEVVSINKLIKQESKEELISSDKPFIFVCPTYAWRLPKVVTDFIKKTKFSGSNNAYFIMTCGEDTSKAINYIQKLCNDKGWQLKGIAEVKMPDGYIALYNAPDKKTAEQLIQKSNTLIDKIASDIRDKKNFEIIEPSGFSGTIKSGITNTLFYKFFVNSKGFYSTDQCIGCGKCVNLCPLNNISLKDKKPNWANDCTHCMACISACPTKAIEYKNKTQTRERYYLK